MWECATKWLFYEPQKQGLCIVGLHVGSARGIWLLGHRTHSDTYVPSTAFKNLN